MGRVEQRSQGRSARAEPPVGIIGRSVARQHVRAEPLLPRRRDGADDRSGARVRIQDPLVPPRRGVVQDRRPARQGRNIGLGVGGLVGVQGRGDGRHPAERRPEPTGGRAADHPFGRPGRHPTAQPGSRQSDVCRAALRHSDHPRSGAPLDHRQPCLGHRGRLDRRHARAGQDGRRSGVVRRSVLGLLEGRAGLQRRLARVRPRRSRAPPAHRLRAGRSASARERPMIALLLAQTIAITGGTVYPVSGPKLANASVLIRDGRIVAVGTNVPIPPDATRIDAAGKWITPGLIDGAGQLGLVEINAVPGTREATVQGDTIAAAFNVAEGINPASTLIPVTRIEGITTALAVPTGNLVSGQAVLIDLDGATIEQMLVKSPVGVVADLSESAKDAAGGSRAAVAERLRGVFRDALEYERRKADFSRAQMRALSASARDLDALLPVLHGRVALIAYVNRRSDIETALRLAKEFKLKLILAGAAEGWEVAAAIAAAGVPVLVEPLSNTPGYDALGIRYGNAAVLAQAGVKVALLEPDTHKSRNLRQQAGNAVSYGMTWDQALRAVTLAPAEIFGVADRYGSLEPGKVANVVVWSGDPFEFTTGVEHVLIRGKEIPLKSRQTELLERYKKLPPTY